MGTRNARFILSAKDRASKVVFGVSGALKGLGAIAVTIGAVAVGRKMVQGMTAGVKVFKEFDKQLSSTAAILSKSKGEIAKLDDQSRKLGRTTQFTARQTAEAQFILAKAGFQVNEIFSAIPGTLDLAAAGEIGIGEAADISAQLIRGFGLDASASTDVADLLAKAANTANTNVTELGEAFKFAAPAAKILGVSLDETAAAIQLVSDRGLKGSLAGTGLAKTMTTILGNVNKLEGATGLEGLEEKLFDTEGKFIGLAKAMRVLKDAGVTSRLAFKIFGERAGKVAGIMLDNVEILARNTEALGERKGFAKAVAEVKLNNLAGDTIKLQSAMEGLQLVVGEKLNVSMRMLTQQLTFLVTGMIDSTEEGNDLALILERVSDAIQGIGIFVTESLQLANVAWAGMKLGFNAVAVFILEKIAKMIEGKNDLIKAFNFFGLLDRPVDAMQRAADEYKFMAEGMADQSADIWEAAITTSTRLDEVSEAFRNIARDAKEAAEEQENFKIASDFSGLSFLGSATAAPPRAGGRKKLPSGGGGGGGVEDKLSKGAKDVIEHAFAPTDLTELFAEVEAQTKEHEEKLTELKIRGLQVRAELEAEDSFERHELKIAARVLEHEKEIEDLGEQKDLIKELTQIHQDELEQMNQDHLDRIAAAKQREADADALRQERLRQQQQQAMFSAGKTTVKALGMLFKKKKAAAFAATVINTAEGISAALQIPPPAGEVLAAARAILGAAQLAAISSQKFQFGGIVEGRPGADRVSGNLTQFETVLPTRSRDEAESALREFSGEGRGGPVVIEANLHFHGDVLDPEEWLERNRQGIGRALADVMEDGGLRD